MRFPSLHLPAILLGLWVSAPGQMVPPAAPAPRSDSPPAIMLPHGMPESPTPRVDPSELRSEARQLLELSESVQPAIEQVNRGVLPKDVIEKLKRIEKLSKQLRGQINR